MTTNEKRYYYVTPKDIEKAEMNGITQNVLYQRVHIRGWDVDRAITQPTRKEVPFYSKWTETAEANGINLRVFRDRVRKHGWVEETAATTPVLTPVERGRRGAEMGGKRLYTQSQLEQMDKHGLSKDTVAQRVNKYGWTMEEAVNTPALSFAERTKRVRNNRKRKEALC